MLKRLFTGFYHQLKVIKAMTTLQLGIVLAFRIETLMWGVIDIIPFFALFFVLQSIYTNAPTIHSATLASTLQYYVIIVVIQTLTSTHFDEWLGGQVRDGKIDLMLVKPCSPNMFYGYTGVVRKYAATVIKLPVLIFLGYFVWQHFGVGFPLPSAQSALPLAGLLITILCVQVVWSLMIGWFAFWFENGASLVHFKWMLLAVFSGAMFPPELSPSWLNQLIDALPFKYFGVIPTQVWLGTYVLTPQDWLNLLLLAVVSTGLLRLTWQRGNRFYASAGG